MKMKTSTLLIIGIALALLGFNFQTTQPLFASIFALTGAGFLLAAARRFNAEKKRIKAEKLKMKNKKK